MSCVICAGRGESIIELSPGQFSCRTCSPGSYGLKLGQARCHDLWCEGARNWTSCSKGGVYLQPRRGYWRGSPYYDTCVSEEMLRDIRKASRTDVSFRKGDELSCSQGVLVTSNTIELDGAHSQVVCADGLGCDEPAHVFKCPNEKACEPGGEAGDMMQCAVGYRGPACALCGDGYVWLVGHECVKCPPGSLRWAIVAAVIFAAFFVGTYCHFVARPLIARTVGRRIAGRLSRCSACGQAVVARFTWLDAAIPNAEEKLEKLWEFIDTRSDLFLGGCRCLIGFMQVIGTLLGASMEWPLDFSKICGWFAFLKIDIEVPSVACAVASVGTFTFYSRLLLYTLAPFAVILLTMVPSLYAKARRLGADLQEELHQNFVQAALFILFVLYPTVRFLPSEIMASCGQSSALDCARCVSSNTGVPVGAARSQAL